MKVIIVVLSLILVIDLSVTNSGKSRGRRAFDKVRDSVVATGTDQSLMARVLHQVRQSSFQA